MNSLSHYLADFATGTTSRCSLSSLQKLDKTVNELVPNYKSFVVTICVVVLAMWYFFKFKKIYQSINELALI